MPLVTDELSHARDSPAALPSRDHKDTVPSATRTDAASSGGVSVHSCPTEANVQCPQLRQRVREDH